jgi:hypothetical protein
MLTFYTENTKTGQRVTMPEEQLLAYAADKMQCHHKFPVGQWSFFSTDGETTWEYIGGYWLPVELP